MTDSANTMAGFDALQVQVGPTLHDLMDTIRDARRAYPKLWAEQ